MEATNLSASRQHFNAARLRSFTWNQLRLEVVSLDEGRGDADTAAAYLNDLGTIERYWAYPGRERFAHLEDLLNAN